MSQDMKEDTGALESLQQSEARLRALLYAVPDMILEITRAGIITDMIPPKEMGEYILPDQYIGRQIEDVFSQTASSQTRFAMDRSLETGQMNAFEFEGLIGDELRSLEARVVPASAESVLMMIRDITQWKWVETEREELIREMEIKNRESETLRESLANIVGTFEFTEIIQRVLDQIQLVIPYDSTSVWRLDGNVQKFLSGRGLPAGFNTSNVEFSMSESNSAFPILTGKAAYVLYGNVQDDKLPDFQGTVHSFVHSWLAVPLKVRGNIIGLIALDGRTRNQFNEHHAQLAVAFANQVAIALENADLVSNLQKELEHGKRLIAELELKNVESETLRKSAAIVNESLEMNETIHRILEQLERVVPYDSASVQLVKGNILEIVSEKGFSLGENDSVRKFEINEQEPAFPVLTGSVPYVLYDDIKLHNSTFTEPPHDRIHAWMAIPLNVKGKILGIIALDGYSVGKFTERHAQLALTYANQVAITFENARLYSDLQSDLAIRQKLISELESKNAELERFTYTASHDLKSPLFTIRGFLGYLKQDALEGNQERMSSDIQRIVDATDKMQQLLNELLELSRVGRLVNDPSYTPFDELAREAVELVQGRIMENGVAVHIDRNMPTVYGDRQRLLEVVQNLVDNAAKFLQGQPDPRIEIGYDGEEDDRLIFHVCDNGIGIPPEHHERIFGLFNKLDAKAEGTGVGLALVRRIIEYHGGRIWVQSDAGKGAAFFFTLPAGPAEESSR